jgi:hypothetical protein
VTSRSFTTEDLLTSPKVFGLTTATRCQRAWWRAADGLDLAEFASDPDVLAIFGGVLPSASTPPAEFIAIPAIRTAKSMWSAAKTIAASQDVDVSGCSAGDIIRAAVVSLTLTSTRAVMSHLVAAVQKPALRPLVVGEPSVSGVVLRHPSGRPIEIAPTPLDRAGGSAASVWSAGVIIDEAPRMLGASDAVKNYDHLVDTVRGRMLPNSQIISVGSPWAPSGPIYDRVQECFGKPSRDCLVMRGTGPQLNPVWWTPERCASLVGTPSYQTDVLGEFADPTAGLLTPSSVRRAVVRTAIATPRGAFFRAAIDPSELHPGGNGFALVVMSGEYRDSDDGARPHFTVVEAREWREGSLYVVMAEVARIISRYRLTEVVTDQFSKQALREIGDRAGLVVRYRKQTAQERVRDWESFVTAFDTNAMTIPDDKLLVGDLLAARRKLTPTGSTVELAHTPDGRHGDLAAAMQSAFACFRGTMLNIEGRHFDWVSTIEQLFPGDAVAAQVRAMSERIESQIAVGFSPDQAAALGIKQSTPREPARLAFTSSGQRARIPTANRRPF